MVIITLHVEHTHLGAGDMDGVDNGAKDYWEHMGKSEGGGAP